MGTTQQLATIERLVDLMGDMNSDVHPLRGFLEQWAEEYLTMILVICKDLFDEKNTTEVIWTVKKIDTGLELYLEIKKNGEDTSCIWIRHLTPSKQSKLPHGHYACFSGPLFKKSGLGTFIGDKKFNEIKLIVAERLNMSS
jgi:hypothetical protein